MSLSSKIRARVEYRLMAMTGRRRRARRTGPVVIANSIPKCGTHLLTRCLLHFPELSYTGVHFTKGEARPGELDALLARTGRGRFSAAHLWWSEGNSRVMGNHGARSVVMVRDPRDVIVSGVFYIMRKKSHHLHAYFASLPDDRSRFQAYINGVDASRSSLGMGLKNIRDHFRDYTRWGEESSSMVLPFEELVGPRGGGSPLAQVEAVRRIAEHLGQELSEAEATIIALNIYSTKSVTFRKGKRGNWMKHLDGETLDLFARVGGGLLTELGYPDRYPDEQIPGPAVNGFAGTVQLGEA